MDVNGLKFLVVGAGFWGCTLAERIATVLGQRVLLIDRRDHLGGNCHSAPDPETGIECHTYGTHIFHTKIERVWQYIRQFSEFTNYRHRVWTEVDGQVYPMPISLATINSFYRINLRPAEVAAFIAAEAGREAATNPANLEEKAVSLVGRPLYEAFIKGYTWKQWETDPCKLPADIIARLPVRSNYITDYFDDPWQGMPVDGYTSIFRKMLAHPLIEVRLNTDFRAISANIPTGCQIFYSGQVDAFFEYALGQLQWRSLRFEKNVEEVADFQGTAVMNQADLAIPFTRTHEYKHLHPERGPQGDKTVVVREYPKAFAKGEEPYYPVNTEADQRLLALYRERLREISGLTLGGRLGAYRYMDMDRTIEAALDCFADLQTRLEAAR